MPSAACSTWSSARRSTGSAASSPTSPPCTTGSSSAASAARRQPGRGHHHARRPARHHGPALPLRPQGQDPARPARAGAAGQGRRRAGLWLPRGRGRDRRAPDRRGRGRGGAADLPRSPPGTSPRAIARRLNAEGVPGPDGRPWQDTHHPRPGRARHRPPQQRALRRPAGLEPLQLRQGPAHAASGWRGRTRPSSGSGSRCRSCGSSTTSSGRR